MYRWPRHRSRCWGYSSKKTHKYVTSWSCFLAGGETVNIEVKYTVGQLMMSAVPEQNKRGKEVKQQKACKSKPTELFDWSFWDREILAAPRQPPPVATGTRKSSILPLCPRLQFWLYHLGAPKPSWKCRALCTGILTERSGHGIGWRWWWRLGKLSGFLCHHIWFCTGVRPGYPWGIRISS